MKHAIKHGLRDPADVRFWVTQALKTYLSGGAYARHKPWYKWISDTSAVVRFTVTAPITQQLEARIDIAAAEVEVTCELPWNLVPFEPIIQRFILSEAVGKEISSWLEQARYYAVDPP